MERAYQYRIYPNKKQRVLLEKHFGATRWLFNYGLQRKIETYQKTGRNISCFELSKELPNLKSQKETEWLKEINAQSLQMSLRALDNAFVRFFRKKKGFPNFKSKKNKYKQSFSIPQGNRINFKKRKASFIKIGEIKIRIDRQFKDKIIKATISKNKINQFFVSYIVDENIKPPKPKPIKEKTTIGIDLGLNYFAVLSNGKRIKNPKYLKKSEQRLRVLQRRLSRKKKGSNKREKVKFKVAKLFNKISNQRSSFLHKFTEQLTRDNQVDTYAIENLNVNGMLKNHCLAKSIADTSWSEFIRQISYKSKWYGKNLLMIGRFEPSSKMCGCGYINNDLKLSERKWTCPECKIKNNRDLLAAQNIKKFALLGLLRPIELAEVSQ
ncbi:MAG: transposase [Candidatus Nealsonbacteria bacterium CG08_land_8_20_14_0_20_38_20]|uniref:Transposase n=1 Tax=Candidatus Nealsonbacteria bacterium CG08_land_8_20_14_0_20_38_20 TaxID=1974705 RepID=A0A2H0YNC9_9BACT|nr:MAG: transposase [Candidatus Nealsonbacteria bacterium CG08_land_8_20_14_0_20_38_20]